MQVTVQSVEKQDDEACLKSLIDVAEAMPKFLRPQLAEIFSLCLKMVTNEELGESWRHLALELVVTTAETAPAMVRKVNLFVSIVLTRARMQISISCIRLGSIELKI